MYIRKMILYILNDVHVALTAIDCKVTSLICKYKDCHLYDLVPMVTLSFSLLGKIFIVVIKCKLVKIFAHTQCDVTKHRENYIKFPKRGRLHVYEPNFNEYLNIFYKFLIPCHMSSNKKGPFV